MLAVLITGTQKRIKQLHNLKTPMEKWAREDKKNILVIIRAQSYTKEGIEKE